MQRKCGNCIYWSANHQEHVKCKSCSEGRNNFVPRDMKCPVPACQSTMIYYAKDAYLSCPDCGTEIWPFHMEKSDKATIRQEFEKQLPCNRSSETTQGTGVSARSSVKGGSKSKSKAKKQPAKKKSTTQLYNELAVSKGAAIAGNRHDAILKKKIT